MGFLFFFSTYLFLRKQDINRLSAADIDQLRLPNGEVNYIHLFNNPALPDPLVIWFNGDPNVGHYEPILLVVYYTFF